MTGRRGMWIGAAALLAIGLLLRMWELFALPFWLDEAYSAYAAGGGLRFLWTVVPAYETHPPFYYTLLWAWEQAFGDSLASLRATSLLASLATLPVLASCGGAIGRLIGWDRDATARLRFAAFGFACLSIGLTEMAREVRPYALMILVYALATRALLAILARREAGLPLLGRAYAGYLACLELMLWLHNLGPLWAAALGLALLAVATARRPTARDLVAIVGGHALAILLYLPGLAILAGQAPTWIRSTWVGFTWDATWPRLGVIFAVPDWQGLVALVLVALGMAAAWRAASGRRIVAVLLMLALLPVVLSIGITLTVAPVFVTRTMTPAGVPALLLFAIGAVGFGRPLLWLGAGAALMLGASMAVISARYRAQGAQQDWYGTVAWLQQRYRPGDLILAYPNEGALPLARAFKDKGLDWPIKAEPVPVPALGWGDWHPTGNRGVVSLKRPVLHALAQDPAIRAAPTIWLLRLGRERYDPGDVFLDELHHDRWIARSWLDGPISIVGLAKPPPAPDRNRR